jgi:4a-hydroxytetrahydrobiopterin dehydratase
MKYPTNWEEKDNFLVRTFEFDNFVQAVEFVNKITPLAEEQGHHPDIEIFSYNKVRVKLTTHDEGNEITEKDVELAEKIESIIA